nr:retrovirus-related Pol polyprotein from transposon TNT 1-94 [Tanacetum cinerariifolium]
GIEYDKTFAPVARLEAIRIFFAYAAYTGFMVYHIDVKSALLNGKISKEVYVQQPPGFESSGFSNHVCKMDKALYGLKQALIAEYNKKITFTLSSFDKPLSFNLDDFLSIIGLNYSENYAPLPPKETVDLNSLSVKVENLESSLSQRVADKIDDLVPRLVADAIEERLLELLSNTLKNLLPDLLKDSVKKALPKI